MDQRNRDHSSPLERHHLNLPPVARREPDRSTRAVVRYRECLKNHAASMGSHVVDGCGEFMPSGEEGTLESLRCAACECHRNFHRKETQGEPRPHQQHISNYYSYYYPNKNNDDQHRTTLSPTALYSPHHHQLHRLIPPMMEALGGGGVESSGEDLEEFRSNNGGQPSMSRKRFRTKFTQEQKGRMMEFAEKLGWKIQKHDQQEIRQFCSQVGVTRQVFKVWMHNNKQARKQQQEQQEQQQM